MNDYIAVRVDASPCSQDITDLAAACLGEYGFESFEPDAKGLTSYIRACDNAEDLAREALEDFPIPAEFTFSSQFIEGEDWNAEWEKNYFKPIVVGNRCVVHSTFHKDVPQADYDIVIDPKMAFGTGHHDTTSQMMRLILDSNLEGKKIVDMGTGTGILSILAKMRGAGEIIAVEIDEPAYVNAIEHARLNNVEINLVHGDASAIEGVEGVDTLFANINRNIILGDIERYAAVLKPEGEMLLSGFYAEDVPMIEEAAARYGLHTSEKLVSDAGWTAMRLKKQ